MRTAQDLISALDLQRHPEGGWYRETWRAEAGEGVRSTGTAIYYLLEAGDVSHWHRVDATEIWHWYAGEPLVLTVSPDGRDTETMRLGPGIAKKGITEKALAEEERPQRIVPAKWWQSAVSAGSYTLVGCTVSPGFEFDGFEMAPPGWHPSSSD